MNDLSPSAEWLRWDGSRLTWRLRGVDGGVPATELRLDGVVFERYPAIREETRDIVSDFRYSPTGRAVSAFSVHASDEPASELLPNWRVKRAEPAQPGVNAAMDLVRGMTTLSDTPDVPRIKLTDAAPAAVVVPIYNAPESVRACIESVLHWTPRAQLILVDDGSDDPGIATILANCAGRANVRVHRNERNRGYTHSVNVGMALAGGADVVLLNSDTEVGPRWLSALRIAAYGRDDVGTVTAVSDNAGAFTVPELEQYCPPPPRWKLVQAQRAVFQQAGLRYPQLPTGNGFCMYIKRALLARIGPMDEAAFPQGYGEENDFCQRAERAGFRNLIAGNVLVRHERSASFGHVRRGELGAQGMAVLRQRYPDYERRIGETLFGFDRRVLDYRIRRTYADSDGTYAAQPPRPRLLLAADAGDTAAERLLEAMESRQEGFLLRREGGWVNLYRQTGGALVFERGTAVGKDAAAVTDVEMRLREWMLEYAIESVHLRGSANSDGWLAGLAAELEIPSR